MIDLKGQTKVPEPTPLCQVLAPGVRLLLFKPGPFDIVVIMQIGLDELEIRVKEAESWLSSCKVCPRACGVDRLAGELGACRSGAGLMISSATPHFGEEPELVGRGGSGTIFLTNCNLDCLYCQNYDLSHLGHGQPATEGEVAGLMLDLQKRGCHNVNFVSPTHYVPQLLKTILLACQQGFSLPLVYNTGGYDTLETLALLDGVIDIYLPDAKYGDDETALALSGISEYVAVNQAALKEMHRQVGLLKTDERGVATGGLLIRHLVLPGNLAKTERVMDFIAKELSPKTHVNIMAQYRPCFKAHQFRGLDLRLTDADYRTALQAARTYGLVSGEKGGQ